MKVLKVIRREYVENVRRRSFIIGTIAVPVVMSLFFVVPVMFAMLEPQRQYEVAVLDQTGAIGPAFVAALTDTLKDGSPKYAATLVPAPGDRYDAARDSLIAALQRGELNIVMAVPEGILGGESASYITKEDRNFNVLERFEDALSDAVLQHRLASEGLDYARVRELTTDVELEMNQLTRQGGVEKRSFLSEYGVVFFFVMVLYSAILSWGVAIAKSITEEKQSRIIEVLLNTLTPRDLMIGKLVGVGLAGFTQLGIWAVAGLAITGPALAAQMGGIHIPVYVFLFFILFFVLGFMLFAALFMVVGAMSSTDQDMQQLQIVVVLPMLIPLMSLMLFMQDPNGSVAVGMSLIPVFTPLVMQARIILLMPPAWQILLGIGLMVVTIYFAVTFAARVYRVGILMHGKRPTIRELVHWYRMAG